jgi:two-component sensor histidine kinase
MALIHEKLYKTQNFSGIDFGHYLKQLTHDLVDSYHAGGEELPTLEVTSDSIEINLDQAIPFGLMVNELISNALKYGKPDTGKQVIHVELVRKKDSIELIVRDNGSGFDPNESVDDSSTLGLQLVKTLTEQLEGTCKFENDLNGGAKVTIDFPYLN